MDASSRRNALLDILARSKEPVTGSSLASRLGVTRQVIVQDIAVLRAQGKDILATPRGYTIISNDRTPGITRLVAVKHSRSETREELYSMVDLGLEVVDVIVDHPVYGQLTGQLSLSTRKDVDEFIKTIEETRAGLLSSLTGGVHLHTVKGREKSQFDKLEETLREKGFLLTE